MRMNCADPEVAGHHADLPAAADQAEHFRATVAALRELENDQTLLVRSSKPAGIFRTQRQAPRVVIVAADAAQDGGAATAPNSWLCAGAQTGLPVAYEALGAAAREHFGGALAGRMIAACGMGTVGGPLSLAATLHGGAFLGIEADAEQLKRQVKTGYCEVMVNDLDEALRILKNAVRKREPASVGLIGNCADVLPELARRGVVPDLLLDTALASAGFGSYIPRGLSPAQAADLRRADAHDAHAYRQKLLDSLEVQMNGTLKLKRLGSLIYRMGSGQPSARHNLGAQDVQGMSELPCFPEEFIEPLFAAGRSLLMWVALSGEPADIARADGLALEAFSSDEAARRFIQVAGKHVQFQGLPARVCLVDRALRAKFGIALNEKMALGEFRAPILLGCDDPGQQRPSPGSRAIKNTNDAPSEAEFGALLAQLSAQAKAASSVLMSPDRAPFVSTLRLAIVADGTPEIGARIARVLGAGQTSA